MIVTVSDTNAKEVKSRIYSRDKSSESLEYVTYKILMTDNKYKITYYIAVSKKSNEKILYWQEGSIYYKAGFKTLDENRIEICYLEVTKSVPNKKVTTYRAERYLKNLNNTALLIHGLWVNDIV